MAAGYRPKNSQVASVLASRLVRNDKVQRRIRELRAVQDLTVAAFVRDWGSWLPEAQQVLIDAMAGKGVKSVQLKAALAIIDRAEGRTRSRQGSPRSRDENPPYTITMWP